MNKVILMGNLTAKPELKQIGDGLNVVNFSIATNETWKDKATGEKKEKVEFHNCFMFGASAATLAQYHDKGDRILVEGKIETQTWEDDGIKKYATKVKTERFYFARSGKQNTNTGDKPVYQNQGKISEPIEYPNDDINPDDIPF